MDIKGVNGLEGTGSVRMNKIPEIKLIKQTTTTAAGKADSVQISDVAKFINEVAKSPDIRPERVKELKAEIQSGKYESMERFNQAITSFIKQDA